jgi:hypothetical protein
MRMSRDRMNLIGGRCLDVALGIFLIAMLVVIWTSSRTGIGSVEGVEKTIKAEKAVSSSLGALTPIAGTVCLQDDSNPSSVVVFNPQTGDFTFCCGGVQIASGTGMLTARGNIGSIDGTKGDRQVHIQWDFSANNGVGAGTAYVEKLSTKIICQITDKNTSNNTCQCSSQPQVVNPKKPPNRVTPANRRH